MTDERSLISVIVPVYNAEKYIADALQSIIYQNYFPIEILVIDDGSMDGTGEVIRSFGDQVKYTFQENSGPPFARNLGLSMAKGKYIAFLDADDLWCENKIALQLKRFKENPEVEIVLGYTQRIRLSTSDDRDHFIPFLDPQPMLSMGAALMKKSAFEKVGNFDESLLYCDDMDWFLRAREEEIKIIIHDDITQLYRKHTREFNHSTPSRSQISVEDL